MARAAAVVPFKSKVLAVVRVASSRFLLTAACRGLASLWLVLSVMGSWVDLVGCFFWWWWVVVSVWLRPFFWRAGEDFTEP